MSRSQFLKLLTTLMTVLVPLWLVQTLWRIAYNADSAVVVNGVLELGGGGWPEAIVTAAVWTWAISAGVIAVASHTRHPVAEALRAAPTTFTAWLIAMAAIVAAILLFGLFLPAGPAVLIVGLILALLLLPLLIRLALVLPVAVLLGERGRAAFAKACAMARGDAVRLGTLLILGVVAPALCGNFLQRQLAGVEGFTLGLIADAGLHVLLLGVASIQAIVLASFIPGREAGPVEEVSIAKPVALLLLPTMLGALVIGSGIHPRLTPVDFPRGQVIAVAWPSAMNPVIVTASNIRDCLDPRCQSMDITNLKYRADTAVISPQGDVWSLGWEGLEHCDARRICERSGELEALAGVQFKAIAISWYEVFIATATLKEDSVELGLLRCLSVECADVKLTKFGTVPSNSQTARQASLTIGIGEFGRPIIGFRPWRGDGPHWAWCETGGCGATGISTAPQSTAAPSEMEMALLSNEPGAPVTAPDGTFLRVQTEVFSRGEVLVWVGDPPSEPVRAVLIRCADFECRTEISRIPLIEVTSWWTSTGEPPASEYWKVAANEDGRVVLAQARAEQILILRP